MGCFYLGINFMFLPNRVNSLSYLCFIAIITILYGEFIENPLIFDDFQFFLFDQNGNQPITNYKFAFLELRSFPYATLAWTKAVFGLELIYFRIGNLLLHVGVTITLFVFLDSLFSHIFFEKCHEKLTPKLTAFFAALLFSIHPVATYGVGYLIQRTIVMATLFSLLALVVYVQGSIKKNLWLLWLSVPLYYLAVFSKEHAIMLPAALMTLTVLLHDDWLVKLKQRWGIWLSMFAIAIVVILSRKGLLGSIYEPNAVVMLDKTNLAYPLSVLTQAWLFFKYAFLWIAPNPAWMSIDMREPFASAIWSSYLIAMVSFVGWGITAVWLLLKRDLLGLAGFGLLFPWLMFMTEFSSVRIQEVFVLYRSYLWVVGAFCIFPLIFSKINAHLATGVLLVIALAMVPITMDRLVTLSHPVLIWDDAIKLVKEKPNLPGVYRLYHNRGASLLNVGEYDQALLDLNKSIEINSDFAEAYGNLGYAYIGVNNLSKSVESFSKALKMAQDSSNPQYSRYIYGRAQALEKLGNHEKARSDYSDSCRLANRGCEKLLAPK